MGWTTEVYIELKVPNGMEPLPYRDRLSARAMELGWPEYHSAGTCFADGQTVVDVQWTVDGEQIQEVIANLRNDFDMSVMIGDE